MSDRSLIEQARTDPDSSEFIAELRERFSAEELANGTAVVAHGGDFLYIIESDAEPHLYINDQPAPDMRSLGGGLRMHLARLPVGASHAHFYRVNGEILDDRRTDTAALTRDSYPQPGVPQGEVSDAMTLESQVYHGYKLSWWIYASPGVDPATPSPVMLWCDGHRFLPREARDRLFVVTENLVHQKKLPPMVHILVSPAVISDPIHGPYTPPNNLRSLLYDTLNDDYNKMIFAEIYPRAQQTYKLRTDGYSTGACGQSSGGICAFNQAWHRPERVSRVISRIGSFASIQWRWGQENRSQRYGFVDPPPPLDGGNLYPFLIRKRPKKNIRVWLSDGSYDLENAHGSWPLQNIQMANSLKMQEYDFYFRFGNAQHNTEQGAAELPEAMTWLWRGYDPEKTYEEFTIDPEEKERPYFRVAIVNR